MQRAELIELSKHEAILAQTKEELRNEKSAAIRSAMQKERADYSTKLDQELNLARQVVEEKDRELEMYRNREVAMLKDCEQLKETIRQLTESENIVRQTLSEKVRFYFEIIILIAILLQYCLRGGINFLVNSCIVGSTF